MLRLHIYDEFIAQQNLGMSCTRKEKHLYTGGYNICFDDSDGNDVCCRLKESASDSWLKAIINTTAICLFSWAVVKFIAQLILATKNCETLSKIDTDMSFVVLCLFHALSQRKKKEVCVCVWTRDKYSK